MLYSVACLLLFATPPADQTTAPRHPESQQSPAPDFQGTPTDPLFDKQFVATDDPAFILTAVESGRQNVVDAKAAGSHFPVEGLRNAAARIARQETETTRSLESLAKAKGWRLPQGNPGRASTIEDQARSRDAANFIRNQITYHQTTIAQYRAQISGRGDPELKRTLSQAVRGYESNLKMLLELSPDAGR